MRENSYIKTSKVVYETAPVHVEEMKQVSEDGSESYLTLQQYNPSFHASDDGLEVIVAFGPKYTDTFDELKKAITAGGLTYGQGVKNIDLDCVRLSHYEVINDVYGVITNWMGSNDSIMA